MNYKTFWMTMKTWMVQPATMKTLAFLFGFSPGVMCRKVNAFAERLGPKIGYFWTVKQILIIIDELGPPPGYQLIYPGDGKK